MHAEAERTQRDLLPAAVGALLDRHDQRRAARSETWRQHNAQARARQAAYGRIFASSRDTSEHAAEQARTIGGNSLEL